jgi:hypothetical protein
LPADMLDRIASGEVPGLTPADYDLPPHERVRDMISRSWARLLPAWVAFKASLERLPESQTATSETRDRWLLVLFEELGFGRLQPARAIEKGGRTYAVSHSWGAVPIHLVGAGLSIDRRVPGQVGAARLSPSGLVQELLNTSDGHRWGMVSNGRVLRVLRDSAALTRQAYLEFDLERMFDGQLYADFALLWLVCHRSRFEAPEPAKWWIERWSTQAREVGVRALDTLRGGVEKAIEALGTGFLKEPSNRTLRANLTEGRLDKMELYRQLLRVVYRLIFLLVAEDRDLLLSPDAPASARERYVRFYSVSRLRRLADLRRGRTEHTDLWASFRVVAEGLAREGGRPQLGLPPQGSFLWSSEAVAGLDGAALANRDFLDAVMALAFVKDEHDRVRRQVDYRNLGPEELGSVYESLLERHPRIDLADGRFSLATAGGNERKTTGSYYTPSSLIANLLDTALNPVIDEAAASPNPEQALLELSIVDPACGSGHFLLAAAHRVARKLASIRTGESEPPPEHLRSALRDVIGHCVYGVDVNPMAVELCKVSMWIDALEPGRPLSFLDHRILCGNSLLGVTPELLATGVPDGAYKAIAGDDKTIVAHQKRQNQDARSGQMTLTAALRLKAASINLGAEIAAIDALPDWTLSEIQVKSARYGGALDSDPAVWTRRAADAWCAAFVAQKVAGAPAITDEVRQACAADPKSASPEAVELVVHLGEEYRLLHWHLAFPDVFARGGFDVVLGNPPWEQMQLQEVEFFAVSDPDIAGATGVKRKRLIADLPVTNPTLAKEYARALHRNDAITHFLRNSGRYPLCGQGRINSYSVFAELMRSLLSARGRAGVIVPTGIATDDTTKDFFAALVNGRALSSLFDFENAAPIFEGVHRSYKFCLLTMTGLERPTAAGTFSFFAHRVEDLVDPDRRFQLTADDFKLLNPNTLTCPIFRTRRDAEITRGIYARIPVLLDRTRPDGNPWGVSFMQGLFNMTSDSGLFKTRAELEVEGWGLDGNVFVRGEYRHLPLYEGKMFHHFDHRFASFEDGADARNLTSAEKKYPNRLALPRYWVSEHAVLEKQNSTRAYICWRGIAPSTNERTCVATIVPPVGKGNSVFIAQLPSARPVAAMASCLCSFTLDFVLRQKLGGTNINFFVFEQLPVLDPAAFSIPAPWAKSTSLEGWLRPRVAELICTASDTVAIAIELGADDAPFLWDDSRRELIRAELDAAFFHLYGLSDDEVDYAMETFPIVRRNDIAVHGEYRTKRLILERYAAMEEAIASGTPYETVLVPGPAHRSVSARISA